MRSSAEIVPKFAERRSCNAFLYTPLADELYFRETRVYHLDYTGSAPTARRFVTRVLVDENIENVHFDEPPQYPGFRFMIDLAMKPSVLDLEKEYILKYYAHVRTPDFVLERLQIVRRFYIEKGKGEVPVERLLRDLANPAIHSWTVIDG